ncbi:AraC family transcriptional regulator ligand-binding domain-containing protein [Sphingopyxis panaciterrae]
MLDLAPGVLVRLCASVLGEGWSPLSICFSRSKPRTPEMQVHRRLFSCDFAFDCEFHGPVTRRPILIDQRRMPIPRSPAMPAS